MTALTLVPNPSLASRLVRILRTASQRSVEISATRATTPQAAPETVSVGDAVADALTWFSEEGRRHRK